jgi:hypothetical protein
MEARNLRSGFQHHSVLMTAFIQVADCQILLASSHVRKRVRALWVLYEDTNPIQEGSTFMM